MLWPQVVERSLAPLAPERHRTVEPPRRSPRRHAAARCRQADERRVGMLQHAVYSVPDRDHGYCIDDNARALMVMVLRGDAESARLAPRYAAFVQHGWNPDTRRFRNFMGYDRHWLEESGSEDSNGRTLWALGVAAARSHAGRSATGRKACSMLRPLMSPASAHRAQGRSPPWELLSCSRARPDHGLARSLLEAAGRSADGDARRGVAPRLGLVRAGAGL